MPSGALREHAAECDACRGLPLDRIEAGLRASVVAVDSAMLSRAVMASARPELERLERAAWWRQVVIGLLLALLPLPAVLAYDTYVLQGLYTAISSVLPATLAAYLVGSYVALLVLLFATTYAAIPVLIPRRVAYAGGVR